MYPKISDYEAVQAHYEDCRRQGTSHALAEMFALGHGPSLRTDSVFMEGHCNGNQFESTPWMGDWYKAQAKAAGVSVKGAVYKSGLARFPGDPEAWVRSRGDVERICRARGWSCRGDVYVPASYADEPDEPPDEIGVAHDIVEQRVLDKMDANPELEFTAKPEDVWAEAKDEIKPSWAK